MSNPYEDEDYFLPLEDQRVFGAGITRKRVPFVRSSDHELSTLTSSAPSTPSGAGSSIANKYLSIVMQKPLSSSATNPGSSTTTRTTTAAPPTADRSYSAPPPIYSTSTSTPTCEICNLPLPPSEPNSHKPHESSLAHQACLSHSNPPSHLDRTRHGLRYLESYGWDPDSRLGLGAPGREGIREPVKGKPKADTVGLGAVLPSAAAVEKREKEKEKVQKKLNAKQVRKGHFDARRKGDKLREMFYRDDDVLRYLGAG
ncbi:hypothetical protein BDW59DRAFT_150781 [Aspergillus cavernicola]|uniref:G-patch domain-containing protein n=1 Tax=Aspergillus cavernicola TaxID=176166 RepID=A0ABR4HYH3_9EURO